MLYVHIYILYIYIYIYIHIYIYILKTIFQSWNHMTPAVQCWFEVIGLLCLAAIPVVVVLGRASRRRQGGGALQTGMGLVSPNWSVIFRNYRYIYMYIYTYICIYIHHISNDILCISVSAHDLRLYIYRVHWYNRWFTSQHPILDQAMEPAPCPTDGAGTAGSGSPSVKKWGFNHR
jgi:hypothetical protein